MHITSLFHGSLMVYNVPYLQRTHVKDVLNAAMVAGVFKNMMVDMLANVVVLVSMVTIVRKVREES